MSMFEKNLSCEMRIVVAIFAVIFLLATMFGKLFAVIGLVLSVFVAITGFCMSMKFMGPLCKKEVQEAVSKAADEVKAAAGEVADDVKDAVKKDS